MAARTALTAPTVPDLIVRLPAAAILEAFAADMEVLAGMMPPGISQAVRGAVQTLRTDLEHAG